eukprot:TRINITY_DN1278_c4_g1_i2.p1 TRINITY_DN1278_c4_g1~~TRINITY_DN1278_c4_g1_i2.p1  ORF type:complete len:184 (+),score=11.17 TRINITY_DN1278_c4_g1_i2:81-632(+)
MLRPSVILLGKFGGSVGGGIGAPTRGLGRFFQRTRALMSFEAMYYPHPVTHDGPQIWWPTSIFDNFNTLVSCLLIFFIIFPASNAVTYYTDRIYAAQQLPLPGLQNCFTDIDDPDWRMKYDMINIEKSEGARPLAYNRYMDVLKGVRVSEPDFKIYIPSEHGEGIGAHAGDILAREKALGRRI